MKYCNWHLFPYYSLCVFGSKLQSNSLYKEHFRLRLGSSELIQLMRGAGWGLIIMTHYTVNVNPETFPQNTDDHSLLSELLPCPLKVTTLERFR